MKRLTEAVDPIEIFGDSARYGKRQRLEHTNDSSHNVLNCASEHRRPNTLPLTRDTLEKLNATRISDSAEGHGVSCRQPIQLWADKCENQNEIEMPPSSSPSSMSWRGNRRRTAKLAQRQRSSSPMKKAGSPQYRAMNMADANIFVDYFPDAPTEVETQLGQIFGDTTWLGKQGTIGGLAKQYCEESRVLAKKCAGESEWRSHLFLGLLQPLERLEPDTLMLSASEKRKFMVKQATA